MYTYLDIDLYMYVLYFIQNVITDWTRNKALKYKENWIVLGN